MQLQFWHSREIKVESRKGGPGRDRQGKSSKYMRARDKMSEVAVLAQGWRAREFEGSKCLTRRRDTTVGGILGVYHGLAAD
jgi:hypothetical protein